jgi:hypothetical protein
MNPTSSSMSMACPPSAAPRRLPALTIEYRAGDWTFDDNFFGGELYGGRSVVFRAGRPIWMLVYYGWVNAPGDQVRPVYTFLQRAPLLPPPLPVRGPAEFGADGLVYRCAHQGDVTRFSGEETISADGARVYTGWFVGGLVDVRRGD